MPGRICASGDMRADVGGWRPDDCGQPEVTEPEAQEHRAGGTRPGWRGFRRLRARERVAKAILSRMLLTDQSRYPPGADGSTATSRSTAGAPPEHKARLPRRRRATTADIRNRVAAAGNPAEEQSRPVRVLLRNTHDGGLHEAENGCDHRRGPGTRAAA